MNTTTTIDTSRNSVIDLLQHGDNYAFISAFKGSNSTVDNVIATASLHYDLVMGGARAIPCSGVYDGVSEDSFMAIGIGADEAIALGRKYGQESILLPHRLVFCADESTLPIASSSILSTAPHGDYSAIHCHDGDVFYVASFASNEAIAA